MRTYPAKRQGYEPKKRPVGRSKKTAAAKRGYRGQGKA